MNDQSQNPSVQPKDWNERKDVFSTEYKKRDDDSRHYSAIRSALTSFLITVGLTLLSSYFSRDHIGDPSFFKYSGFAILIAAVAACLIFSWRTQRSAYHMKQLWKWATQARDEKKTLLHEYYPAWDKKLHPRERRKLWWKMTKDPMNVALILVILAIITLFEIYSAEVPANQAGTGSQNRNAQACKCKSSFQPGTSESANSRDAAEAYTLAAKFSAEAAQTCLEATKTAADAAKTYVASGRSGDSACKCAPSCAKRHEKTFGR